MSSIGTRWARQALSIATTTFRAANDALAIGMQTCDERAKHLDDAEIKITNGEGFSVHTAGTKHHQGSPFNNLMSAVRDGRGGVAAPSQNETPTLWGDCNYDLDLRVDGALGCITAKANRRGVKRQISIVCRWKRRLGTRLYGVDGIHDTQYKITADDIRCNIVVEVTPLPTEAGVQGTAYGEVGPFEITAATRKSVEFAWASKGTRFPALVKSSTEGRVDDATIYVRDDGVMVAVADGFEHSASYSGGYPSVLLDTSTSDQFELVLGEAESDKFVLQALSRAQRDLIALTVRSFHARQFIVTSAVLDRVAMYSAQGGDVGVEVYENPVDLLALIQQLAAELNRTGTREEKASKERNRALAEKCSLEQDITATIDAYQQLLIKLQNENGEVALPHHNSSSIALQMSSRAAQAAELDSKLHEAQSQTSQLQDELQLLRREHRMLQEKMQQTKDRSLPITDAPHDSHVYKIIRLEQQIDHLSRMNEEITRRAHEAEGRAIQLNEQLQREREHTTSVAEVSDVSVGDLQKEIRRLKETIDEITFESQSMRSQNAALQCENKELKENFLYIKDRYDHVLSQMTNADDVAERKYLEAQKELRTAKEKVLSLEKELRRVNDARDAVLEDNDRLLKKAGSLSKDLTKTKQDAEKSLAERNLLEQSLRSLELNLEDDSKLWMTTNGVSTDELVGTDIKKTRSKFDLVQLVSQLQSKEDKIKELQTVNQNLRSKVRKLATVG